jgi:hypothetical protein
MGCGVSGLFGLQGRCYGQRSGGRSSRASHSVGTGPPTTNDGPALDLALRSRSTERPKIDFNPRGSAEEIIEVAATLLIQKLSYLF